MNQNRSNVGVASVANILTSHDLQSCLQTLEATGPLRISPPDVHTNTDCQALRTSGGCIVKSDEYLEWVNGDYSQLLRLVGSTSCGKTTVSEIVVEKLKQKIREHPKASLACFFCNKESGGDTPPAILRSLLFQLIIQKNELYPYVHADFKKESDGRYFHEHLNDFSALWKNLRDMLQDEEAGPVFIVVDALDACRGSTRADLLRSIKDFFHSVSSRGKLQVKLLVTYAYGSVDIDNELGDVGVVLGSGERRIGATSVETTRTGTRSSVTTVHHNPCLEVHDIEHQKDYVSMIELLLRKGANMMSKDNRYGRSPLSWAAGGGQGPMVKLLLEKGVEIECKNNLGRTPLSYAAENGHEAVVKLLVRSGARINTNDSVGYTPLLRAIKQGHVPIVRLLLRNGASVHCKTNNGQDPVSLAADNGHLAILDALLANDAAADSSDLANGRTPLSRAAEKGHEFICQILCERRVTVDSKDAHNQTPLLWAARNGHERSVKQLLQHGASTGMRDSRYNQTPIIWACKNGHETTVKLLVDNTADMDSIDKNGRTPLSWAAGNGEPDVVELLLNRGAKINYSDQNGRTPLSWAAGNGQIECVRQLLHRNAEFSLRDRQGRTPLSWALENTHGSIVSILREGGQ